MNQVKQKNLFTFNFLNADNFYSNQNSNKENIVCYGICIVSALYPNFQLLLLIYLIELGIG